MMLRRTTLIFIASFRYYNMIDKQTFYKRRIQKNIEVDITVCPEIQDKFCSACMKDCSKFI